MWKFPTKKKPWVSLNGGVLYERGMGVENSYGIHPYDLCRGMTHHDPSVWETLAFYGRLKPKNGRWWEEFMGFFYPTKWFFFVWGKCFFFQYPMGIFLRIHFVFPGFLYTENGFHFCIQKPYLKPLGFPMLLWVIPWYHDKNPVLFPYAAPYIPLWTHDSYVSLWGISFLDNPMKIYSYGIWCFN